MNAHIPTTKAPAARRWYVIAIDGQHKELVSAPTSAHWHEVVDAAKRCHPRAAAIFIRESVDPPDAAAIAAVMRFPKLTVEEKARQREDDRAYFADVIREANLRPGITGGATASRYPVGLEWGTAMSQRGVLR